MLSKHIAKKAREDPETMYCSFVSEIGEIRAKLFGNMMLSPSVHEARSDIYDIFRGIASYTKTIDAHQTTSQGLH
jgi:hypothetical protein